MAFAQLSIPTTGVPVTQNFTGFAGGGFDIGPSAGRLAAGNWALTGMSDGNRTFGDIDTVAGDLARGVTTGSVVSGGLYALNYGVGNTALLIQPTGSDWNPGTITLRLQNNTGGSIAEMAVSYDIVVINDQPRANSFNFSYSLDDVSYIPVAALDYTTPAESDASGPFLVARSTTLTGLSVPNGAFVYLRWNGADVSGGGSRDEYGLDNISVTASASSSTAAFNFASSAVSVDEGAGSVSVPLTISMPANCSVQVVVSDGTATNGMDYTAPALSTRTFTLAGATTQNLSIPIIDDNLVEGPETFTLTLQNATGGCIIGAVSLATVTIIDNDSAPIGDCLNLYFSEYIEGSSNNKALEIYNPTGAAVDLSAYSVKAFNNGATIPTNSLILSGTLAAGDVYVIANGSADSAILAVADVTSTVTFYNGNDAVILFNGGDTIDAIGTVGEDPGINWPVGTGATSEYTLVRKPEVKSGQNKWVLGADEWLVYPQDEFGFLGSHSQDACDAACNSSNLPTNQNSTNLANRVVLTWDPIPGAVGCQVNGKRLPSGPQPSVNVLSAPYNTTNVPYAAAGAGTTWTWRVRCACNISPLDVSAFSAFGDTFSIPAAREMMSEIELTVFPNPATDVIMMGFGSQEQADALIEVSDMLGRVVYSERIAVIQGANQASIPVSQLENGMYFVRIGENPATSFTVSR